MTATKEIKGKIASIRNTQSIARAMEMIAAVKMRKAQDAALATRVYAQYALEILARVKRHTYVPHFLMRNTQGKRVLFVLITSDKGLCGGFNACVLKSMQEHRASYDNQECDHDVITIGMRGAQFAARRNYTLVADFSHIQDSVSLYDVAPISRFILDAFTKGTYSQVHVVFNKFISTLHQQPQVRQLLPLQEKVLFEQTIKLSDLEHQSDQHENKVDILSAPYTFEPDTSTVLNEILPRLVEMQVYQAILESKASEHSARMVAMKNAKDNAGEFIQELTQIYNKARQAAVTQEISEIVSGVESMRDV